jgi:hypothetical protein
MKEKKMTEEPTMLTVPEATMVRLLHWTVKPEVCVEGVKNSALTSITKVKMCVSEVSAQIMWALLQSTKLLRHSYDQVIDCDAVEILDSLLKRKLVELHGDTNTGEMLVPSEVAIAASEKILDCKEWSKLVEQIGYVTGLVRGNYSTDDTFKSEYGLRLLAEAYFLSRKLNNPFKVDLKRSAAGQAHHERCVRDAWGTLGCSALLPDGEDRFTPPAPGR